MNIRTAEPTDARRLATVHVESWRSAYRGLVSDAALEAMSVLKRVTAWEEILAAASSTTLVGEVNDDIVGFASYGLTRDDDRDPQRDAELYALYVLPSHWDRGCGFRLWSQAESLVRATHATLSLWVFEANRRARRFYERQGCGLDPDVRKTWRPEAEALVEVRYTKSLEPADVEWPRRRSSGEGGA